MQRRITLHTALAVIAATTLAWAQARRRSSPAPRPRSP